eukprot:7246904-Lingulodinium_polyedra.AAC.1
MGLSQARAAWLVDALERGRVPLPELYAAVGRLGFAAQVLPWERPFLGPVYSWAAACRRGG